MFVEKQSFHPVILYTLGFFGLLSFSGIVYAAVNTHKLTASEGFILALSAIFVALIFGFVFSLRLHTRVADGNLSIKFWPFTRLSIPLSDIARTEIVKYKPIADFGGWGIRRGLDGVIYSMRGQSAVKIARSDGSVIYVGTENPEELLQSIRK